MTPTFTNPGGFFEEICRCLKNRRLKVMCFLAIFRHEQYAVIRQHLTQTYLANHRTCSWCKVLPINDIHPSVEVYAVFLARWEAEKTFVSATPVKAPCCGTEWHDVVFSLNESLIEKSHRTPRPPRHQYGNPQ